MATHHPYSFSDPREARVTRRRRLEHAGEPRRAAAWDSEAPATAHDHDFDRKESRAPLYVAGVVAAAVVGGLVVLGAAAAEPELQPTMVTETVPRQAALSAALEAQALDRARLAIHGMAPSSAVAPAAPDAPDDLVDTGVAGVDDSGTGAMSVDPTEGAPMSVEATEAAPMSVQAPEPATPASQAQNDPVEPLMTPVPSPLSPSAIELDSDNPYTPEKEPPAPANATPRTPSPAVTSDNPY